MMHEILKTWGEIVLGLVLIMGGCPLLYLLSLKIEDWFIDLPQYGKVLTITGVLLVLTFILALVVVRSSL